MPSRYFRIAWTVLLAVAILNTSVLQPAVAQTGEAPSDDEGNNGKIDQIRSSAQAFVDAFNDHDADALGQLFTEEGEYVSEENERFLGRDAIVKEYTKFFAAMPDVNMLVAIESIRFLNDHTAIEDGVTRLDPMPPGAPAASRYTAVHLKGDDGKWRLASVRDNRIALPNNFGRLEELAWMQGSWRSEHQGVTADVTCRFIAGGSFLQRAFKVVRGDQLISSSVEIIGWCPLRQSIMSWVYSSGGGRSIGNWTHSDQEGWLVAEEGITADGLTTVSNAWWASLGPDSMGWSSLTREKAGTALEVPRDVVFQRVIPDAN